MIGHWIDMEMALNFLFHVLVGYLYVFFGKTSIQINSLFLNPVITLAFLLLFLRYWFVGVSYIFWDFPDGSAGKMSASSARDTGSACPIPGWGRSPGGGNGNPHQYSCLKNPMDREAWWATVQRVTESQIHVFWVLTPYQICGLEIFTNEAICSWAFPCWMFLTARHIYCIFLVDISFYHYVFSFVSSKNIWFKVFLFLIQL